MHNHDKTTSCLYYCYACLGILQADVLNLSLTLGENTALLTFNKVDFYDNSYCTSVLNSFQKSPCLGFSIVWLYP